jgi:hypothetical protein
LIDQIALGVGITLALALIAWIANHEARLIDLQSRLIQEKQKSVDLGVEKEVFAMSDDQLDIVADKARGLNKPKP